MFIVIRDGEDYPNGYFLSRSLNAEENPVDNDYISSITKSRNFNYKQQYLLLLSDKTFVEI